MRKDTEKVLLSLSLMAYVQHWRDKDFFSKLKAFLYIFLSHLFHFSVSPNTVRTVLPISPTHAAVQHTLSSLQTSPDAAFDLLSESFLLSQIFLHSFSQ